MKVATHKIHWPSRFNGTGQDIHIEVTECDCYVSRVTHGCARWGIGEAWFRVSIWFEKKGATITLGEYKEVKDIKL